MMGAARTGQRQRFWQREEWEDGGNGVAPRGRQEQNIVPSISRMENVGVPNVRELDQPC